MQKIMIIEDEPAVREEMAFLLENEGYKPLAVTEFQNITQQVREGAPDLILLDVGLPGRDGLSLCRSLRQEGRIPIIFVTSRDSTVDELKALSLGGDDYITKPYNIPVLLARIKTVLRRAAGMGEPEHLKACGMKLDLARGTVEACDKRVELSRNELQILAYLMRHAGEIVSRADLIDALWDSQIYIDDNTLSVNMTRLRGRLEELGMARCIKTRRGMGYQLFDLTRSIG